MRVLSEGEELVIQLQKGENIRIEPPEEGKIYFEFRDDPFGPHSIRTLELGDTLWIEGK